jgi:hypothetical protein
MSNLRSRVRALLEARQHAPPPYRNWSAAQIDAEIVRIFERIRARQAEGCAERYDSPESRRVADRVAEVYAAVAASEAKYRQRDAHVVEKGRIEKLDADAEAQDERERQAEGAEVRKLEQLWEASPERASQ